MFSEFMSISSSLMLLEPEAKGAFLSCFPLKEHFDLKALFSNLSPTGPPAAQGAARALVQDAISASHEDPLDISDITIIDGIYLTRPPNHERATKVLFWRSRQMSTIWCLFIHLADRGFVDVESLEKPMAIGTRPPKIEAVVTMLCSFDQVSPTHTVRIFPADFTWLRALEWLAIVIIRSWVKPVQMFEMIALTGYLGTLDVNEFGEQVRESGFPHDLDHKVGEAAQLYGFWLPHGMGTDRKMKRSRVKVAFKKRKRINQVAKEYFQI